MALQIDRRRLLATGALSIPAALLPSSKGRTQAASPVNLTAGRRTLEVNGRAATVFGLTQPDGTHGMFTEIGKPFRLTLHNDAGTDTLIHWHGLSPPYRQDGVPGISAPAVTPGGTAQYDFPLNFPGTFWMHSHQGLQEQSLMSAPLIIRDNLLSADRQEVVLMLHDFSFRSPEEIYEALRRPAGATDSMGKPTHDMSTMQGMVMSMSKAGSRQGAMPGMAMDLNDVVYDAFLANDHTLADPMVLRVERRGRVLLRVINASATSNFRIDLSGVSATLVAVDGHPVQKISGSIFPIAVAQRLDLEFQMPADPSVVPVFATLEGERQRTGIVLANAGRPIRRLPDLGPKATTPLDLQLEQRLHATAPLLPKAVDRVHQVNLTGSMENYVWGLNGVAHGDDKPLMIAKGQRVELIMTNQSMMSHPMHLHGHFFQVVAIGGRRFAGAIRDTVLVPPMQSVTVVFDADNPGRWAFHCHNLYHMEAGMMTTLQYETF